MCKYYFQATKQREKLPLPLHNQSKPVESRGPVPPPTVCLFSLLSLGFIGVGGEVSGISIGITMCVRMSVCLVSVTDLLYG